MRVHYLRLFFATLLACATPVDAAETNAKYIGTVSLDGVQISTGPSLQYPHTGRLRQGEQVQIHHEDNGWYAILPRADAISWVNHRFLGDFDRDGAVKQNAVIKKDKTEIRFGSSDPKAGPLGVRSITLPFGTIVKIMGPKQRFEESWWYPIEPPAGEYRFIPKYAVSNLQSTSPRVEAAKTTAEAADTQMKAELTSNSRTPLPNDTSKIDHPLWAKAEQLHRSGDFLGAEQLYTQIYNDLKQRKAEIEIMLTCLNRIDDCRAAIKSQGGPAPSIPASRNLPNRENDTVVTTPIYGQATGALASGTRKDLTMSRENNRDRIPPANIREKENPRDRDGNSESTGPGFLRRTAMYDDRNDRQRIYALEDQFGKTLYYLISDQGLNLENYINRKVELFGQLQTRGDIRGAKFMIVTRAELYRPN